jgi:predicted nucleotidyltransferase component of viral defense system
MFLDILDKKRINILPFLANFKSEFYLAGRTALALQIGHRDSIDFDFFTKSDLKIKKLFTQISDIFQKHEILKIQEEKNTLTILLDNKIKISFFTYKYDLLKEKIDTEFLSLASIEDIACMKLSAILSRATVKDYIDLYYILEKIKLADLIVLVKQKYPEIDSGLILKSLIYFKDIKNEKIIFKNNKKIEFNKVKKFLIKEVRELEK